MNHDANAGQPRTIVLLHSLGTDRRLWRHQAALADDYEVLTPELPGHGARTWTGQRDLAAFVRDLEEQLAAVSGPLHLVGVSMGGHLAVGYAAAHPDRVASVVIANSFARLPIGAGDERVAEILSAVSGPRGMETYATDYLEQTLTVPVAAADRSALHTAIASMSPEAYLAAAEMTFCGDLTQLMPQVGCPVLIVAGAADHKVPQERTQELVDGITGAQLTVLEDAGHLSCVEQPEAFNATVTSFIEHAQVGAADEVQA